jgi:cell division protein FtsL
MAQIGVAYDLELFSSRKPHLVEMKNTKKAQEDTRRRSRRQSLLNLVVYLAVAAVAIALVGYFITCNVRLTEINKELMEKQSELNALQSEEVRLRSEVAGMTSSDKVDAYVQETGMSPVNSNQIYYIEATEEDQVSLPEENGNWLEQAWNAIVDFLS